MKKKKKGTNLKKKNCSGVGSHHPNPNSGVCPHFLLAIAVRKYNSILQEKRYSVVLSLQKQQCTVQKNANKRRAKIKPASAHPTSAVSQVLPALLHTHRHRLFLLTKTQPGIILPCKLSCFVVCDQICLSFSQTPTTHAAAASQRLERDGDLRTPPLSSHHQETQNRLAGASPQAHLQGRKGL